MWQVCDTCGAIIFDFVLHAAWHSTLKPSPNARPDPAPSPTKEPA